MLPYYLYEPSLDMIAHKIRDSNRDPRLHRPTENKRSGLGWKLEVDHEDILRKSLRTISYYLSDPPQSPEAGIQQRRWYGCRRTAEAATQEAFATAAAVSYFLSAPQVMCYCRKEVSPLSAIAYQNRSLLIAQPNPLSSLQMATATARLSPERSTAASALILLHSFRRWTGTQSLACGVRFFSFCGDELVSKVAAGSIK